MSKLFTSLSHEGILKEVHFVKGIKAVVERIDDLQVDIPHVSQFIQQFISAAMDAHCISKSVSFGFVVKS